jgi:hypothetical protein
LIPKTQRGLARSAVRGEIKLINDRVEIAFDIIRHLSPPSDNFFRTRRRT